MNFGGLEKTISSSLREKNVVKFGILDKINFDDLQEKKSVMKFDNLEKIFSNNLREKKVA